MGYKAKTVNAESLPVGTNVVSDGLMSLKLFGDHENTALLCLWDRFGRQRVFVHPDTKLIEDKD